MSLGAEKLRVAAPLPDRAGTGFKPEHFEAILADRPSVGFFEIHAENYMGEGGPPHRRLEAIRALYPVSLHGVGLSIGSPGALDKEHLKRLALLNRRYEPGLFSEHLAWSSHNEGFLNDLLPLPYTQETLDCVCDHIDETQNVVGRRMLLENPSTYVLFEESTIEETEFLREIAKRTGCGLLLDVNNIVVSATNHGYDPAGLSQALSHRAGRRDPPRRLRRERGRRRQSPFDRRPRFAGAFGRVGALRRRRRALRADADARRVGQ